MGGGSHSPLWCQIIVSVLRRSVVLSRRRETTSLGAGMLAAFGARFLTGFRIAAKAIWRAIGFTDVKMSVNTGMQSRSCSPDTPASDGWRAPLLLISPPIILTVWPT